MRPSSKLLVVTLHAQVQPVFVDLRKQGGRWELATPPVEGELEDEEDEEVPKKSRFVVLSRSDVVIEELTDLSQKKKKR